jgi:hypothetical protein
MFLFNSRPDPDHADPLQSPKAAADWLRGLPALDVTGRQEQVIGVFSRIREAGKGFGIDRVAALLAIDQALAADHRRLLTWHLENLARSPTLADRFWQMARDRNQCFTDAYHRALAAALGNLPDRPWKAVLPRLAARLIHLHGIDLLLNLFRGDAASAAMWTDLHGLFLRSVELGIERRSTELPGDDPLAQHPIIEHEYVYALLLDLLRTGNLTAVEIEWAAAQLFGWCRNVALLPQPVTEDGFFVDFTLAAGLARHRGMPSGAKIGYIDTTPVAQALENELAALREPAVADESFAGPVRLQRIATLEKIRPAIAPSRGANLRRHPRIPVDLHAEVCIGLARITRRLALAEPGTQPQAAPAAPPPLPAAQPVSEPSPALPPQTTAASWPEQDVEEIEIPPVAEDARVSERGPAAPRVAVPLPIASAPPASVALRTPTPTFWRIADRSLAGLRISTNGGEGQALALGALVAVLAEDIDDWSLGVVRRLIRDENLEIAAGLSVIARSVAPVVLHGLRRSSADMSFIVDGIDVATLGPRFDGLYLTPTKVLEAQFAGSTLVVPTSEHFEGRNAILTTAHADYAVTLGRVIEAQAEWSWVAVRIAAKVPHGD